MEQRDPGPSVLGYSVVGYLLASAVGVVIVVLLSVRAGDYDEQRAFQILVCIGAIGALGGFEVAAFGGGGFAEEWTASWGSIAFYVVVAAVLGGSFLLTLLGTLVAMAVAPPPLHP